MGKAYTVTIDLSEDDAAFVDAQLADGAFTTVSELAATAIQAFREEEAAADLTPAQCAAVKHTYEALRTAPTTGITASDVQQQLAAYHQRQSKDRR